MGCTCHACVSEDMRLDPPPEEVGPFGDMRLCRMFLCETCGNKRCPRAADHRNACTNSNTPGQKGSLYEDVSRPPASAIDARQRQDRADGPDPKGESAVPHEDAADAHTPHPSIKKS